MQTYYLTVSFQVESGGSVILDDPAVFRMDDISEDETHIAETAERDAVVEGLANRMVSAGWTVSGQGGRWWEVRFSRAAAAAFAPLPSPGPFPAVLVAARAASEPPHIDSQHFDRVLEGMSYCQVASIFGSGGEDGGGSADDAHVRYFSWGPGTTPDWDWVLVKFRDNAVIEKAHW